MAFATLMTGPERRRRWPEAERVRILAAAFAPGAVVTQVARENEISKRLIYKWRDLVRRWEGTLVPVENAITLRTISSTSSIQLRDKNRICLTSPISPCLTVRKTGGLTEA
jgi:transposase